MGEEKERERERRERPQRKRSQQFAGPWCCVRCLVHTHTHTYTYTYMCVYYIEVYVYVCVYVYVYACGRVGSRKARSSTPSTVSGCPFLEGASPVAAIATTEHAPPKYPSTKSLRCTATGSRQCKETPAQGAAAAASKRTTNNRRAAVLYTERGTQYLPATFGMSWEKSGVL